MCVCVRVCPCVCVVVCARVRQSTLLSASSRIDPNPYAQRRTRNPPPPSPPTPPPPPFPSHSADEITTPESLRKLFTERLVYMPDTYFVCDHKQACPLDPPPEITRERVGAFFPLFPFPNPLVLHPHPFLLPFLHSPPLFPQELFTERLVYMPDTYYVCDHKQACPLDPPPEITRERVDSFSVPSVLPPHFSPPIPLFILLLFYILA